MKKHVLMRLRYFSLLFAVFFASLLLSGVLYAQVSLRDAIFDQPTTNADPDGVLDENDTSAEEDSAEENDAEENDAEENDAEEDSAEENDGNRTKKRYAVYFFQSHRYNYYTDLPEEDPLNELMLESFYAVYEVSQKYGNHDASVVVGGANLTRKNVFKIFQLLAEASKPGDEILIYWNGHGGGDLPSINESESGRYDEYLVTFDANATSDMTTFRESVVTDDDMGELIAQLKGRHIMAIFETCHAGGLVTHSTTTSRSFTTYKPVSINANSFSDLARMNPYRNGVTSCLSTANNRTALENYAKTFRISSETEERSDSSPRRNSTNSLSENDILRQLNLKNAKSTNGTFGGFLQKISKRAKDISNEQPDMVALFACQEHEFAWGGTMLKDENGDIRSYGLNPMAFAYYISMEILSKESRTLQFEEYADVFMEVLKQYVEVLNELQEEEDPPVVQTPLYLHNLNNAYLRPPVDENGEATR